jgi:DNA-binding NtrC family response regulator
VASKQSPHILVVDSDELALEAITEMIESLGYRATGSAASLKALQAFSENPEIFDLAIIEPAMPEVKGLDLATRFRRIRPGFRVLFYAGYLDEHSFDRIRKDHIGRIAFKPLLSAEMSEAIRTTLRGRPLKPSTR